MTDGAATTPPRPGGKPRHKDRRCVGTGAALAPGDLALRFVADPDGVLTPDLKGQLPGRGAWITADRDALSAALQRGQFARVLKAPVRLPEGASPDSFAATIADRLLERALERLGQARRCGECLLGFGQVRAAAPTLIGYVTPEDAAADGVRKIVQVLEATGTAPHIPLRVTAERLSHAVGDPGAVHLGLVSGGTARQALYEAARAHAFGA